MIVTTESLKFGITLLKIGEIRFRSVERERLEGIANV